MDFSHIHASLLYSVPWRGVREDLDFYRERADLITTTETSKRDRAKAFRNVPGWAWFRPGGGAGQRQNSVTWKTSVFERDGEARAHLISNTRWRRVKKFGGNLTPAIFATVVPLRHRKTGRKVFVLAAHLPSAVEGGEEHGYRDGTPNRVKAHRESLISLRELAGSLLKEDPDAAIVLAADWNMNHRREVVQEWLLASLRPLGSCWKDRLPKKGTHGKRIGGRVIDASYVFNLLTGAQKVFEKRKSDHRAYRAAFEFAPVETGPLTRGNNVDDALEAIEKALRWNEKRSTKKVPALREAREALLAIEARPKD